MAMDAQQKYKLNEKLTSLEQTKNTLKTLQYMQYTHEACVKQLREINIAEDSSENMCF